MKKSFFAIVMALALALTMLPAAALAANKLPDTLEAPSALHIRDDAIIGEGGKPENTSLWISFNKSVDLGNILTVKYDYDFGEYYGVDDCDLQVKAQLDWSMDDQNHWQYSSYWDQGLNAHGDDGNILPGEYTTINLNPDTTQEESFFNLGTTESDWEGDDDWASRIPASAYSLFTYIAGDEEYYRPVIDWNQHTLYVRMRYLIRYKEIGNDDYQYIYSPWSAVVSFGKNAVAYKPPTSLEKPVVSDLSLADYTWNDGPVFLYKLVNPQSVKDHSSGALSLGDMVYLETQVNIGGQGWIDVQGASGISDGERDAKLSSAAKKVDEDTWVQLRSRYHYWPDSNSARAHVYSDWSNVVQMGAPAWGNASSWAEGELAEAEELGLIPDVLIGQDLTKPITRAEFAAVAVKIYEYLSGETATVIAENPFTDTNNADVLKARNLDLINGYGSTTVFAPDVLLNREMAATLLTRVYKKINMPGWTLDTDSSFALKYTKPAAFKDDKDISAYAKDSVYFMAANEIIEGNNGNFMPRAVTEAQEAIGYAQATREQAIIIAARMAKNL